MYANPSVESVGRGRGRARIARGGVGGGGGVVVKKEGIVAEGMLRRTEGDTTEKTDLPSPIQKMKQMEIQMTDPNTQRSAVPWKNAVLYCVCCCD